MVSFSRQVSLFAVNSKLRGIRQNSISVMINFMLGHDGGLLVGTVDLCLGFESLLHPNFFPENLPF